MIISPWTPLTKQDLTLPDAMSKFHALTHPPDFVQPRCFKLDHNFA